MLDCLLGEARLRIRNGQLTESGLARLSGISQPHMHHILMGKRGLHPDVADRLLAALSLDIAGLMELEAGDAASTETADASFRHPTATEPVVLVPILSGLLGPGFPSPKAMPSPKYLPLHRREIPKDCALRAARLAHDSTLEPLLLRDDLVVIAMNPLPPRVRQETSLSPRVMESNGAWYIRKRGDAPAPGNSSGGGVAEGNVIFPVGVVVLTIRRMRSLNLSFSAPAEDD